MKNFIVNSYMNHIKKYNNYSEEKLEKIEYGLTGLYLTFSKMIIIFLIAIILGIFKEMFILMILFNILRTTAFGMHASKSWVCLIISIIAFIGLPILCIKLKIHTYLKISICIICIVLFYKYAPADTKKRPIINKKRRFKLKISSTIISIVFSIFAIVINNNFICNCLIFSMILEIFFILPSTYKFFNLPYNNYISYLKEYPKHIN